MNKKFVYQFGNNKKLYYDAWPTEYQGYTILHLQSNIVRLIFQKTADLDKQFNVNC
jgi:hypothetical protein